MFVKHSEDNLVYVKYLCVDSFFFNTRIKILQVKQTTFIVKGIVRYVDFHST